LYSEPLNERHCSYKPWELRARLISARQGSVMSQEGKKYNSGCLSGLLKMEERKVNCSKSPLDME